MPKLPVFIEHLERLEAEVNNLLKCEHKRKEKLNRDHNINCNNKTISDKCRCTCSCINSNSTDSKNCGSKTKKKTKTTLVHQQHSCKCSSKSTLDSNNNNNKNKSVIWSAKLQHRTPDHQVGVFSEFHKDISFNKGNKAVQISLTESRKATERRMLAKSSSCPLKSLSDQQEHFNLLRQQRSIKSRSSSLAKRKCTCNINTTRSVSPKPDSLVQSDAIMAKELSHEIRKVKNSLQQICQCKAEAENMTHNLKSNYRELVSNKNDLLQQIGELCNENQMLNERCTKFEQESIEKDRNIDQLMKIVGNCEERIQDLENRAYCAANDIRESKMNFQKCLSEKDKIIANLKERCLSLEKSYNEKCLECDKVIEEKRKMHDDLFEIDNKYSTIAEANTRLCTCLKKWENELKETIKERDANKNLINDLKEQNALLVNQLQDKIEEVRIFEQQISGFRDVEHSLNDKVLELVDTINNLEEEVMKINKCNCDYKILQGSYEQLNEKYKESTLKLEQCQKWADRCQQLEKECREQFEISSANEQLLKKERDQMRSLVEELTLVVKQNKETLLELSQINRTQQEFIDNQNSQIVNQTKEIESVSSEIEAIKQSKEELEDELKQIKLKCSSCSSYAENFEEQKPKVRFSLNEYDDLRIKDQIINDQKDTISKLQISIQERNEQVAKLNEQLAAAEDQLAAYHEELVSKINDLEIERYEKDSFVKKISKIDREKQYLIKELNSIRDLLETETYCNNGFPVEEYEKALLKLKFDFEEQKKRWCEQRSAMLLEKEKAIHAAQFATQKLLETVADFQKQVTAQKHIQKMLTGLLHEKDILLREAQSKILTISSISGNITSTTSEGNSVAYLSASPRLAGRETTTTYDPSSFYQSCSTACSKISNSSSNTTTASAGRHSQSKAIEY